MGESENQGSDFIRVMTALFKEDIEEAMKKVYKNRIRPTFLRTMSDSLKDLIDQMFHTTSATPSAIPAGSANNQKTDYTKSYISGTVPSSTVKTLSTTTALSTNVEKPATSNSSYNALPNYVRVSTYEDAQNIVNFMNDKIREDGEASVNDLFDCAGKSSAIAGNSVASRYGWYNIDAHTITQMADGQWMLSMPPYNYLKKEN